MQTPGSNAGERNVVIIGGGFAGTTLARRLERLLPAPWRVVLISQESYTTFNPMLAEVVGASVFPEHVIAPIRQMIARTRFVMARVTDIDRRRRLVVAETLAGVREIHYEHLVFAFGSRANLSIVPGMAEHALPLKLIGDAMFIRNRVLQRVARIELESDPVVRRRLGHFVVVGGGFSGVEVAGELADFLAGARRYYPRVAADELAVTILQDGERLLPELPECLGRSAARSMGRRGIRIRLGARASLVDADGVMLASGERIDSATVICTIGTRANPVVERLALATQRGRIVTAADMAVDAAGGLWALGDCALVPNAAGGQASPPTAQFAVAQATQLADNLASFVAGRPTRPFRHVSRGMMATTGHMKGVAQIFGLRLWGLPAWLLWRAYYLMRMPTFGRKLRIWVEWSWSMFFSADITHLRFTRSSEADEAAAAGTAPAAVADAIAPLRPPARMAVVAPTAASQTP
ncbi:MAG: FAD-dependent oxidoreductase [Rhodocyclaceae bacterium]|nr:FAD-dependent oxidoreductase [Rhodocyclaceae bacterium]